MTMLQVAAATGDELDLSLLATVSSTARNAANLDSTPTRSTSTAAPFPSVTPSAAAADRATLSSCGYPRADQSSDCAQVPINAL